jgi:hypothetical protein
MPSSGPRFPGTTANLSNAGTSENTDAWTTPSNVANNDGAESTIVAASYDSPDISQILVSSNFGFAIPTGSTIDGIEVEIERRSIIANSGKDFRVQLAKGTTFASLVGNNKAVPATIWPTSIAVATYGGATDLWGTTWTPAEINASSFAIFLSAQANIANADIGVDFIRITVHYTPPPPPEVEILAYRVRNDDGSESGATWKAAQNTDVSIPEGEVFRVRFLLQETGGIGYVQATGDYMLRRKLNAGSFLFVGAESGTVVLGSASAFVTDETATTSQLTGGSGSFVAGKVEASNARLQAPLTANNYTELEFTIVIPAADVVDGDVVEIELAQLTEALGGPTERITITNTATNPIITVGSGATPKTGSDSGSLTGETATVAQAYTVSDSGSLTGETTSLTQAKTATDTGSLTGETASLTANQDKTASDSAALTGETALTSQEKFATDTGALTGEVGTDAIKTPADAFGQEAFTDNPVAWWRLDEPSGLTIDEMNGSGGSVVGGVVRGVDGPLYAGDESYDFNGTTGGVNIPDQAKLDVGDVFTLEAWIAISPTNGTVGVRTFMSKESGGYQFSVIDGFLAIVKAGTAVIATSTIAPSVGNFHHVVWTKNGATNVIYIDKVVRTGTVTNQTITNNAQPFHIGYEGPDGEFFEGTINDVLIYGTPLSAARVAAHYDAATLPPAKTGADTASLTGEAATVGLTASDSGIATDPQSVLDTGFVDSGVGVEAVVLTDRDVADAGTGTEAATVSLVRTDTGVGVDTATATQDSSNKTASDVGSGVDALAVLNRQVSEAGTGQDAIIGTDRMATETAAAAEVADRQITGNDKFGADTGTALEAIILGKSVTDTGSGTEAGTRGASAVDSASGTDTVVARDSAGAEAGSGTEAVSGRAVVVNEAGNAIEQSSRIANMDFVVTDSAVVLDTGAPSNTLTASDTASATEAAQNTVPAAGSDSGSLSAETATRTAAIIGSETGTVVDAVGPRTIVVQDTASANDTASLGIDVSEFFASDSGGLSAETAMAGAEHVRSDTQTFVDQIGFVDRAINDSGTGTDTATSTAAPVVNDSGSGTEVAGRGASVVDAGSGTEASVSSVAHVVTDAGFGVLDALPPAVVLWAADTGAGVDVLRADKVVFAFDTGHGTEGYGFAFNRTGFLLEQDDAIPNPGGVPSRVLEE